MLKEKKHLLEQVEREYLLYHAHAPFVFPSLSFCHGFLCPASGCSISPCHLMAMGLFDCAPHMDALHHCQEAQGIRDPWTSLQVFQRLQRGHQANEGEGIW